MHVLDFSPMNESRSTCVSLDALKGRWAPLRPNARMHSFRASRDLLISAPSIPESYEKKKKINQLEKELDSTQLERKFTCLTIGRGGVGSSFVSGQIDQGEFAVKS